MRGDCVYARECEKAFACCSLGLENGHIDDDDHKDGDDHDQDVIPDTHDLARSQSTSLDLRTSGCCQRGCCYRS